jgi:hypothetical protein
MSCFSCLAFLWSNQKRNFFSINQYNTQEAIAAIDEKMQTSMPGKPNFFVKIAPDRAKTEIAMQIGNIPNIHYLPVDELYAAAVPVRTEAAPAVPIGVGPVINVLPIPNV